jgi:hypothetical protein
MKLRSRAFNWAVVSLLPCFAILAVGSTLAGTPQDAKAVNPQAVSFAPQADPWAFSAGVVVRSIDADFHLSPPRPLNFGGLLRSGRGDVGLFRMGDGSRTYDNGSVTNFESLGPGGAPPGPVPVALAFGGSVHNTGRVDSIGFPISEFDFYSHSLSQSFNSRSVDVSDSDVGVGPYLELSRRMVDRPSLIVDAFLGWSLVETSHSSGDHTLATQTLYDTLHTYTYEGQALPPGFPSPVPGLSGILLINPAALAALGGNAGYRNPTQSDRTSILARFYAVTGADLDVHLNEIPVGLKIGRKFGRLTLLAELGGSLNVIDYDLDSATTWYRSTGGVQARKTWNDSASPLKVGLFGGVAAQCDLTANGRFFLEAHGTYRWVDSVHAAAGPVSTEIDVSSWEGGLSLGVRL